MARHHCGAEHDDRYDELVCDAAHEVIATLVHDSAHHDQPPTEAQVRDLYAHLATVALRRTDPAELVHRVLDLGWRPVVGVNTPSPARPSDTPLEP